MPIVFGNVPAPLMPIYVVTLIKFVCVAMRKLMSVTLLVRIEGESCGGSHIKVAAPKPVYTLINILRVVGRLTAEITRRDIGPLEFIQVSLPV